jgi:hypothetical protein
LVECTIAGTETPAHDTVNRAGQTRCRTATGQTRIVAAQAKLILSVIVKPLIADALESSTIQIPHRCPIATGAVTTHAQAGKAGVLTSVAVGLVGPGHAGAAGDSGNGPIGRAGGAVVGVIAGEAGGETGLAVATNAIVVVAAETGTGGQIGRISGRVAGKACGRTGTSEAEVHATLTELVAAVIVELVIAKTGTSTNKSLVCTVTCHTGTRVRTRIAGIVTRRTGTDSLIVEITQCAIAGLVGGENPKQG